MASADRGLPGGGAAHLVRATGRAGRVRIRSPGKRSATGETCRHGCRTTETQKAHPAGWAFYLFDAWQFPTLTWGAPTLPSALRRFTSEFGMGSGGTTALSPPGIFCFISPVLSDQQDQSVNKLIPTSMIIRIILILTPSGPALCAVQNRSRRFCLSHQHQNTFGVVRLSLTGH